MHFNDYYQGHNTTDYQFQAQFLDLSSCIIVSRPSKRGEKILQLSVTRLKWRSHRRSADFLILNTTLLRWGVAEGYGIPISAT